MHQLHPDLRVLVIKFLEGGGHPLVGRAGENPHPDQRALADPGSLPQPVLHGLDLLHDFQQALSVLGEGNPPLVPVKELDPQLILNVVDNIPQTGLGVAQHMGRLGEAAALRRLDDGQVFPHSPSNSRFTFFYSYWIIISYTQSKVQKNF